MLDVPVVVQRWGGPDSLSSEAISRAGTVLGDLCVEAGIGALPAPALTVDPCPPSLRSPAAGPASPMRFVPYNGAGALPAWSRGRDARRRVCVSFGLFGTQAAVHGDEFVRGGGLAGRYRTLAAALARRPDVETVFSVPQEVRGELGELPGPVRVAPWIPLDAALRAGDLVIHHGGIGTAMTACVRGAVQLLMPPPHPVFLDCATSLAARGVGRTLDETEQEDAESLTRTVHEMLDSAAEEEQARELATEIAEQPSPAEVIADVLGCL
nr:nucleotide disphospho-sugar-binding domain-containing protein [Streptomyces sp. SID11385]